MFSRQRPPGYTCSQTGLDLRTCCNVRYWVSWKVVGWLSKRVLGKNYRIWVCFRELWRGFKEAGLCGVVGCCQEATVILSLKGVLILT